LRFFTLFCLFVIIINWFVTSFSVPDANDRYVSYKNIGLLPAFGHLTLSAYAYAVGCLPLVISIYYIFRRDSKLLSAKIVPLIVLMVYTVFFYSAFLRKDIPYFFYYSRYLAPFLPVLLVVSGICINGIKVSYKRMFALVSILILMPFSSFLWFNKDHSRIYFDALEQIINEVKTFKNEDAVFISLDLMPILYLPLEASVDCMVLPFSKYDYFQQVDSPERNTYILSKENSFEIAQLFPAKSSLYERPEGNKLIVYPLKSNKINYNIYLNKTDRPGVLVPIYNYGEELIFGTGGNELMYLDTGWSHDEDGFRWTDASKASLLIPIYSTNKDLLVTLTGNPYQGQPLGDITVNGTRLDYSFNEEGILSFEIPQELANSELRIEFSLPNASSPPTADARLLGIAVSKLLITEI
ncbi:MAG: hypothetical protein LBQ68_08175, partial [Clostridiales bacterium]|nr:hypothetical protein [Clostridiales bacterium]